MNLKNYLDIAPEVKSAVEAGKPVVALESTILSHGMPYPENLTFAAEVERRNVLLNHSRSAIVGESLSNRIFIAKNMPSFQGQFSHFSSVFL